MPEPPKDAKGEDFLFFGSGLSKPKPQGEKAAPKKAEEMADLVAEPPRQPPEDPFYKGAPATFKKAQPPEELVIQDEAPAAAPASPEEAKPVPRPDLKDKLKTTFSLAKKNYKTELKEVLKESPHAVSLRKWRKKGFSSLDSREEQDYDAPLSARLLAKAKKRPLLASMILMTALVVFAVDLLVLMRHLNITRWSPMDLARERGEAAWDDRTSALSLLDRGVLGGGESDKSADPITASATRGTNQLAAGLLTPELPSGLGGIANPDSKEDKKKLRKKDGIEVGAGGIALGPPGAALESLDRTRILKTDADSFTPYSGKAGGAPPAAGVYFGEAGESLDNYAGISHGAQKSADFKAPDADGEFPAVPEGLHGEELVQAMIGDNLMEELKRYAKEGTWRMRRAAGSGQDVPEVDGNGLANSYAAGQLLETKRETDKAMKCGTCTNESRINMERATFYGERY